MKVSKKTVKAVAKPKKKGENPKLIQASKTKFGY